MMAQCSVTSEKFVCPKDFAEVINTEGLCLDDIDDDCELFVIQAPADADVMKLNGQQLVLNGQTNFYYPGEDGQEEQYRCTVQDVDRKMAKGCLVLPERSSMKLCAVRKCIAGVIYIKKKIAFPEIGYPVEKYGNNKVPPDLVDVKKRAAPLCSGNSVILPRDYGKKITPSDITEDTQRANDSQSVRKKKHSRHRTHDVDPSGDIPVKSKKKHKDKKQAQPLLIQARALSDSGENSFSDENLLLTGTECKTEVPDSMDPSSVMSQNDVSSSKNHFASVKKKKKHRSREAEENESGKIDGVESYDDSPKKPHKKKHKTADSSFTDPLFMADSQKHKKDKMKQKDDKLKKMSSKKKHGNHNNTYATDFEIKEEIDDSNTLEGNTSELSTSLEQKSKKKKKKKENYDDQSSACLPGNKIKEEFAEYMSEKNNSYTDRLNDISHEEVPSSSQKKVKKKKKKNSDDCSSSSAHISNYYQIKEEIEEDMSEGKSRYTNSLSETGCDEVPPDQKKKLKKKKKKRDKVAHKDES